MDYKEPILKLIPVKNRTKLNKIEFNIYQLTLSSTLAV